MSTDTVATPERPRFLLAPEVWLALGMEADAVGGVAGGSTFDCGKPGCLYGLAAALDGFTEETKHVYGVVYGTPDDNSVPAETPVLKALQAAGITFEHSDTAVYDSLPVAEKATGRLDWERFATKIGLGIKGVDDVGE